MEISSDKSTLQTNKMHKYRNFKNLMLNVFNLKFLPIRCTEFGPLIFSICFFFTSLFFNCFFIFRLAAVSLDLSNPVTTQYPLHV